MPQKILHLGRLLRILVSLTHETPIPPATFAFSTFGAGENRHPTEATRMHSNSTLHPPATVPLINRRTLTLYILLVVVACGAFLATVYAYRRGIENYQAGRAQGPTLRAAAALAAGDNPAAQAAVAELLADTPHYVDGFGKQRSKLWEGPLLRDAVTPLEDLTVNLMNHGLPTEAEQIAWKSLLEYHAVSRTLEVFTPWKLIYQLKASQGEWGQAGEVAKILAAHGANQVRQPGDLATLGVALTDPRQQPLEAAVPSESVRGLKDYYELATFDRATPQDYMRGVGLMRTGLEKLLSIPRLHRHMLPMLQRALLAAGKPQEAQALFTAASRGIGPNSAQTVSFWSTPNASPPQRAQQGLLLRDPHLLDIAWLARPSEIPYPLAAYVASYAADPRVRTLDFSAMQGDPLGYFNRDNQIQRTNDGSLILGQSTAARMPLQIDKPVYKFYLSYESTTALGVFPIALVRFRDADPFIPLYLDSARPDLAGMEVNLPAGNYQLTIVYLNDSGFAWRDSDIREDRQLTLHRLLLVHTPPAE